MSMNVSLQTEIQGKFDILIAFCETLVYKDEYEANKYETDISMQQSALYNSFYLNNNLDQLDKYRKNTVTNSPTEMFKEHNSYYRDLFVNKNIDMFISRIHDDFDIIDYKRVEGFTTEDARQFIEFYTSSLTYFKHTLYSSAFGDSIEQYRNFIRFFVTFMTIERFFDWMTTGENINVQLSTDYGLDKLLLSHGIDFLADMPSYYKRKVLYNLGYIIRYKGSTNALVSIFEIFNLNDVEVFKYYLTKKYEETGDISLYFHKIPYNEKNPKEYLDTLSDTDFFATRENYESVVATDKSWKATIEDVKKAQFNFIATKYMDIESIRNIQKFSTDLAYMMSFIYQVKEFKNKLNKLDTYLEIFNNSKINLFDLVVTLNVCMMDYIGYSDTIISNSSDLKYMYAFNPQYDKRNLSTVFMDHFETSSFFSIKKITNVIDMNEFTNIIETNLDLRDKLLNLLDTTQDPDVYWAIEKDYQYLFMSKVMNTMFDGFATYSDYLSTVNIEAVNFIDKFKSMTDEKKKSTINDLYVVIENILNTDRINFGNRTFLITYLRRLISFFKSYTVELRSLNFSFYIDGPLEKLKLLDKLFVSATEWHKAEFLRLICTSRSKKTIELNLDKLSLSNEAKDFVIQFILKSNNHTFFDNIKEDNLSTFLVNHDVIITEILYKVSILEITTEFSGGLPYEGQFEVSKFHELIQNLLLVDIKEFIIDDHKRAQFTPLSDQTLNTGVITRQEKIFLRDSLSVTVV